MSSRLLTLLFSLGLFLGPVSSLHSAQFYNDWAAANSSGGPYADPDLDGESNVVEFAYGTDPFTPGMTNGTLYPFIIGDTGTNDTVGVTVLQREGHQPGVQIDLYLSADLTNWFRPWWLRTATNSAPEDPAGSVRESFTTQLGGTNIWFARSSVTLVDAGVETATYYIATNGSDSNAGTSTNSPFYTLNKAASLANPGDLIYLRGGTYYWPAQQNLSRSGSSTQSIRVRAWPGEQPICDLSGAATNANGFQINGSWWHLYGLELRYASHNGMKIQGASNIIERCVVHECGDTGIHITSTTAHSNLVLNCDSYLNYDAPTGGDADGFSAKFELGYNNVFRGCRCWGNSDDGWDLWQATNRVVVEYCLSYSNGFNFFDPSNASFDGNGIGFKLGGNYYYGPHLISHNVSFRNHAHGYDQNNNLSGLTLNNNTAWANGGKNYNLNHGTNTIPHVVRNNLSMNGTSSDGFTSGTLATNNSWQLGLSPAAGTNDLLNADPAYAKADRRDDGAMAETPFLRPVPTARLVNKGVDIGEPYFGTAPDVGAFETPQW